MIMTTRHAAHAFTIVIKDIAMVCAVLMVFALFHHVLPKPGNAMSAIVALDDAMPADHPPETEANASAQLVEPVGPTPEPACSLGDFTAVFPQADTGSGALHSYQSDTLRVAIDMVQANDVTYYVADVWVKDISAFQTAFAKNQYGTGIHAQPVETAQDHGAVFAVSGDYYGARNEGVVIRNGNLYRDSVNSDVCVLYADGTMETYSAAEFNIQDAIARGAWQAWGFGPRLLDANGQAITEFNSAIKGKNPRNALGYYEPGHYCFVTVDGRQTGYSVGMTLSELSQVFSDLGCKAAFNLDGGATAEMIFQGQLVNKPYKGGRQSSDIICF